MARERIVLKRFRIARTDGAPVAAVELAEWRDTESGEFVEREAPRISPLPPPAESILAAIRAEFPTATRADAVELLDAVQTARGLVAEWGAPVPRNVQRDRAKRAARELARLRELTGPCTDSRTANREARGRLAAAVGSLGRPAVEHLREHWYADAVEAQFDVRSGDAPAAELAMTFDAMLLELLGRCEITATRARRLRAAARLDRGAPAREGSRVFLILAGRVYRHLSSRLPSPSKGGPFSRFVAAILGASADPRPAISGRQLEAACRAISESERLDDREAQAAHRHARFLART